MFTSGDNLPISRYTLLNFMKHETPVLDLKVCVVDLTIRMAAMPFKIAGGAFHHSSAHSIATDGTRTGSRHP